MSAIQVPGRRGATRFQLMPCVAVLLLTLAAAGSAGAGPRQVRVHGLSGKISVVADPRATQVTGSASITVQGDEVTVRPNDPGGSINLVVPPALDLIVKSASGDISVRGVRGRVTVKTASGDVAANGIGGGLVAQSVSGSIKAGGVSGKLLAKTVSGDVEIQGKLGEAEVMTVSGHIKLIGFSGGRVGSTSGVTQLAGQLPPGTRSKISTHSGRIRAVLRAPGGVRYQLTSFSGELEVTVRGKKKAESERKLEGVVGAGRASLDMSTFSGEISLELAQ